METDTRLTPLGADLLTPEGRSLYASLRLSTRSSNLTCVWRKGACRRRPDCEDDTRSITTEPGPRHDTKADNEACVAAGDDDGADLHSESDSVSTAESQAPLPPLIHSIEANYAWHTLNQVEKNYAHWLSHSVWQGSLAVLHQTSPIAPSIFQLFMLVFGSSRLRTDSWAKFVLESQPFQKHIILEARDVNKFVEYAAAFFSNLGDYSAFDNTRLPPPGISVERFVEICLRTPVHLQLSPELQNPWFQETMLHVQPLEEQSPGPTEATSAPVTVGSGSGIHELHLQLKLLHQLRKPVSDHAHTPLPQYVVDSLTEARDLVSHPFTQTVRVKILATLAKVLPWLYPTCESAALAHETAKGLDTKADEKKDEGVEGSDCPVHERLARLGLGDSGTSGYYNYLVTADDISLVDSRLADHAVSSYNTRVFRGKITPQGLLVNAQQELTVTTFAAMARKGFTEILTSDSSSTSDASQRPSIMHLVYEDCSPFVFASLCECLRRARNFAPNAIEGKMVDSYLKHFLLGDVDDHITAQELWMKIPSSDMRIEFNMGFIESYRDPAGIRGEFEGLVCLNSYARVHLYAGMLSNATALLRLLPSPDLLSPPSLTEADPTWSLDLLTFAGSSVPTGINLPNYSSTREALGFKALSFSNVTGLIDLDVFAPSLRPFLSQSVRHAYMLLEALQRVIGYGSAHTLQLNERGEAVNFPPDAVHPLSHGPIIDPDGMLCYKPGETFTQRFGNVAVAFDELRSWCVALRCLSDIGVLHFCGVADEFAQRATLGAAWGWVIEKGITGLRHYDPSTDTWSSALSQALFSLTSVLYESGCFTIQFEDSDDEEPTATQPSARATIHISNIEIPIDRPFELYPFHITFDPMKISDASFNPLFRTLFQLQLYRVTGDTYSGIPFFEALCKPRYPFTRVQRILADRQRPSPLFAQPVTVALGNRTCTQTCSAVVSSIITENSSSQTTHEDESKSLPKAMHSPVTSTSAIADELDSLDGVQIGLCLFPPTPAGVVDSYMCRFVHAPPLPTLRLGVHGVRDEIAVHPAHSIHPLNRTQ